MDHFQRVAHHVIGLVQCSETRQYLIINALGQQNLVKGVELLDFADQQAQNLLLEIFSLDTRIVGELLQRADGLIIQHLKNLLRLELSLTHQVERILQDSWHSGLIHIVNLGEIILVLRWFFIFK